MNNIYLLKGYESEKMKIVVLSSHTPSLFWFRTDMMLDFIALGHDVVAIGNEGEEKWQDKFSENGIKYRCAIIQRNGTNPFKDLQTLSSIKKLLKYEKPDKIFTYQAKTVIYGGIAANQLGISEVYPLIAGVGSVFLSDSIKAKIVRFVIKNEYRIGMRKCPNIFFQNPDDVEIFAKNKIIDTNRIIMINGSGVSLEEFTVQPFPDTFAFLCIARLIRDKGVYEYLQACRIIKERYPKVRCLLVGPFDTNPSALIKEELHPYIDDGIIEYFGEQPDVRPYLAQCSVYVLPSYREGTPKTVLEAMATGRAVITTDAPGCRETVVDGQNGCLVPIKDIDALAEKMELLINSPDIVTHMALIGRNIAVEKYDVKLVNNTIIKTMQL